MPVQGFKEHWAMSCSLNLASCRLRAEALARQLHSNLWSPRSAQGSPGDSGCVSPCFGLPPAAAALVIDRAPHKLHPDWRMSSLDDEEEQLMIAPASMKDVRPGDNGSEEACASPMRMSPPYSPIEKMDLLPKNGIGIYGNCRDENHVWRPDSPPESFASESEIQSDSPALTIETEEPSSTTSNSTETVSELASPTYDYRDEGSPLADELRSRLQLIESSLTSRTYMTSPIEELSEGKEDNSISSTLSSDTQSGRDLLSPPDAPRLVRSTSLKTGKTPPGTPSRKKIVRFADVLGLDLEAIRHFVKDDDAPIVPQSAFANLRVPSVVRAPLSMTWSVSSPGLTQAGCKFVAQFEQPGSDPYFLDKVRQQKVALENAVINDLRVTGVIRVLNLGFEKLVTVRYTTTEWAAHTDLNADYVPSSCDGFSDKFSFNLHLPHLSPGQRLVFALKYVANGQEFWDNNSGENYVLKCQVKTPDQGSTGLNGPLNSWMHHFL